MTHNQKKWWSYFLKIYRLPISPSEQRPPKSLFKKRFQFQTQQMINPILKPTGDLSIKHWCIAETFIFVSNVNDSLRALCLLFNTAIIYWWLMANKQNPLPFLWLLLHIYGLGPLVSFQKPLGQCSWYPAEEGLQKALSATQVNTKKWTCKEDVLLQLHRNT